MRIIQSFWSKPAFSSFQSYTNARKFGGFLNFRYFLISSAYSCLTLQKHHGKVWMYTDTQGMELMNDLLRLPFEEISTSLDALESEDHRLWIRGKMHVIKEQQAPFIHVDNDIYVWETLPQPKTFILQSRCPIWTEYKLSLNEIFANFEYIPECLLERPTDRTLVANVGLIGGHDIDFFQRFCELSRDLLERNRQYLPLVGLGGFNQMMEEYLFTSMLRHEEREAFYLMESLKTGFPPSYLNFALVPVVYRYIHLIGQHKQSVYASEQLELRLKYEFPHAYARIEEILRQLDFVETDLKKDETRQARIAKSLSVFYQNDIKTIGRKRIRIRPGAEVTSIADYFTKDRRYAVQESDCPTLFSLPPEATSGLRRWLDDPSRRLHHPFTIDELKADLSPPEQFELLNSIAFNLLHTGLMEFV